MDTVNLARTFHTELEHERITHKSAIPYPWLQAKMKQIGLETYIHNFTLNYPFGGGKRFEGKNIYGILRAPRIGSTESIVLSAPYRPPNTAHTSITAGVPLLLAFADFARRQKYWSKDIIFLVTDQEQLGIQAFLEAYYGDDENNILDSGTLYGKAGSIVAAINFEIQDFDVNFNNLKIEGLNGQLPNLDLHNLVVKLSHKNGIPIGYKSKMTEHARDDAVANLLSLLSMMWTQSSGVPNGNHGLFHKYGIEALTIEAVKRETTNAKNNNVQHKIMALLKIVEGISRSLNNLLERFHQSFFFYVIVSADRFISIGDYMPCVGLMSASLLIKSFLLWLMANNKSDDDEEGENADKSEDDKIVIVRKSTRTIDYLKIGTIILCSHIVGVAALMVTTNKPIHNYLYALNIPTQTGIFYTVIFIVAVSVLLPKLLRLNTIDAQYLNIVLLIELGTMLLSVSMLNFSLGFFLCVFIAPFAILINIQENSRRNLFVFLIRTLLHLLIHPITVVYGVICALSFMAFNEMNMNYIMEKSFSATIDAITFAVVDSLIYGNWLFDLTCLILMPCWTILWIINFSKPIEKKNKPKSE
jgi:glycosylphosphatidylinositol transamidase